VRWTYSTQSELVLERPVRCEVVAYCRNLEFRWLRLAQQAHETGGALGYESGLTATLFPLHDRPAVYPAEYARRAGEDRPDRALVAPI
jgi:hypothetical protein